MPSLVGFMYLTGFTHSVDYIRNTVLSFLIRNLQVMDLDHQFPKVFINLYVYSKRGMSCGNTCLTFHLSFAV